MKNKILGWLASSPLASIVKIAAGQFLVWAAANVASLGLPAAVQLIIGAGLTVAINYLNPADSRYGA